MKKTMKFYIALSFFMLIQMGANLMAQSTVSGKITDSSGEPIPGVAVIIKGTSTGVSSDYDGNYSIEIKESNPFLLFQFMGYTTQEIEVKNRSTINVVMEDTFTFLEEVVVIGYGTAKVKDLTAPIAIVKSEEITKVATSSAMSAVQGKVAGVQIINSGAPGQGPQVKIRGEGSFFDNLTGPLYVVDGMFYDNINFLSPSDIETMSILKDASAAAIYGVRAANGVVLIETKKGGKNRPATVVFDSYYGVQKVINRLEMGNSAEFAQMMKEKNAFGPIQSSIDKWGESAPGIPKAETNWYDEMIRDASIQNYSLTVSGGSDKFTYSASGAYFSQDGIMNIDNYFRRITSRMQSDYQAFDWLKIGGAFMAINSNQVRANDGAWQHAFNNGPIMPIEDMNLPDNLAFPRKFVSPKSIGLSTINPFADMYYGSDNKTKGYQVSPSFYAQFNILKDNKLVFKTSINQSITTNMYRSMEQAYTLFDAKYSSKLTKGTDISYNYIWDNTLTYRESFKKHNFTFMAGHSQRSESWRQIEGIAPNVLYGKEEYYYLSNGTANDRTVKDDGFTYNSLSFFGRATYDFAGKYLLSATLRQDGNSKYQEKKGTYPSVGLGWVVSEEEFLKNIKSINFLKLRGSWGKLGNDKVASTYGSKTAKKDFWEDAIFGGVALPGYTIENNFTYLKWEKVNELNLGFDLTMLNNRLGFEFDYYKRITENAVMMRSYYGDSKSSIENGGKIENKGFEFTLSWNDKAGDFRYGANATLTTLQNKILELGGMSYQTNGTFGSRISRPGDPLMAFYGYQTNGIYQTQAEIDADPIAKREALEPGDFRYVDQNKDGLLDAADRVILGSHFPDVTYGLNLNLGYKNFDISMMLMGQEGAELFNQKRANYQFGSDLNFDKDLFDGRWTKPGDNKYPSAKGMVNPWNFEKSSDYYIEDASFFRIQNIQLAYTFENKDLAKLHVKNIRLSLTADRPLTIFKSNGFTPEVANGIDDQVYPLASTYSFGVKITF